MDNDRYISCRACVGTYAAYVCQVSLYYRLSDEDDIKQGFVYNTAPHVSLSDMANNTEIDNIHAEYAKKLDSLLELLNTSNGTNWKEWEVPNETGPEWDPEVQKLHREWLSLKRDRQREMNASTGKRAKKEILYDRPHEDRKRIRVTGPFTVESLSPHLVLDPSDAEVAAPKIYFFQDFARLPSTYY